MRVRWSIRRDMAEVEAIEKASFGDAAWPEERFIRCLQERNTRCTVVESDDRIAGFMFYELHKTRIEVVNFAVDPQYRRMGAGLAMVERLQGKLSTARRRKISVNVPEVNLIAQLFWKSMGFYCTDIERDTYRMEYLAPWDHSMSERAQRLAE